MGQKRRKWTGQEKLQILGDVELYGMAEASRMHDVSTSMLYRWKSRYDSAGEAGLSRSKGQVDRQKRDMEREIERLRQVVADQALTIRIKDELLKKTRYR